MTTKTKKHSEEKLTTTTISSPPGLFTIQYPNCRQGMFSLRRPFPNLSDQNEKRITHDSARPLSQVAHPEYLQMDQNRNGYPNAFRSAQQDAQVQCSLPTIDDREEITLRRHPTYVTYPTPVRYRSPHYRVQLQLQPARPNIYQVWQVNTPPPRTLPANPRRPTPPRIHVHSPRLVRIRSLSDDDDSDSTDQENENLGILYARRCPRRTCVPRHLPMLRVRHHADTICY